MAPLTSCNDIAVDMAADIPLRFQSYDIRVEDTKGSNRGLGPATPPVPVAQGSDAMRAIGSGTNGTRRAGPDGRWWVRGAVARARNWRWPDVRRVGVTAVGGLLCCTLLANGATSAAHQAGEGPTTIAGCKNKYPKHDTDQAACLLRVHVTISKCEVYPLPCIGHILSEYNMDCDGGGAGKLLTAKCEGHATIEMAPNGNPEKQPFVWHSVPSVKIVAVFIVHNGANRDTFQRIPTGPHSGHVTLKWFKQSSSHRTGPDVGPPRLLLEGTRIR
jgi:hypothetical protein